MNESTLVMLLNAANIPFLKYPDAIVFASNDGLHKCFLDEHGCVESECMRFDGMTLIEYAKQFHAFNYKMVGFGETNMRYVTDAEVIFVVVGNVITEQYEATEGGFINNQSYENVVGKTISSVMNSWIDFGDCVIKKFC